MTRSPQLSLPVHLPDDETFASFYAGGNSQLLAALRHLALDEGERMIYIWGAPDSGRSHLLHACCAEMNSCNMATAYIPLDMHAMMAPAYLEGLENLSLVCLDNIDAVAGHKDWETAIFDFYNRRKELDESTRLIVTASAPANQLNWTLPDLASRLSWGVTYRLVELSDAQKIGALQLRAELRGLRMPLEVSRFLIKRISRDMPTLLAALDQLDKASITEQRKLTIPFVKETLGL